jgi:hypothetical protein
MIIFKIVGIVIIISFILYFILKDDDDYFDNMSAMNMGS